MAKNGGNQFTSGPIERGKATAAHRLWSTMGGFGSFREGWKWQGFFGDCPGLGRGLQLGFRTAEVSGGSLKNRQSSILTFRVAALVAGFHAPRSLSDYP